MTTEIPRIALTLREFKMIRFAVWRFMHASYSIAADAALARRPDANVEAFMRDGRDAEALLAKLPQSAEIVTPNGDGSVTVELKPDPDVPR